MRTLFCLFSNVPFKLTIDHMEQILQDTDILPHATKEFLSVFRTSLLDNVCRFIDQFYEFFDLPSDGLTACLPPG